MQVIGGWQGESGGLLAPREMEGLLHCANGYTVKEAARKMGVSPETLKKRLDSARLKFNAPNLRALVSEAFRRQLISPAATALALVLVIHGMLADDVALLVRRGGNGGERRVELRVAARRAEQQVALG